MYTLFKPWTRRTLLPSMQGTGQVQDLEERGGLPCLYTVDLTVDGSRESVCECCDDGCHVWLSASHHSSSLQLVEVSPQSQIWY
jgi:hypothetical protein